MTAIFQSRELANAATEKLKVYAQPQRLMILSCLLDGERTVGEIDAATGIGQPALSQQLAELRRAELVQTRKEAKSVFYALADAKVALCVRSMEVIFSGQAESPDGLAALVQASHRSSSIVGAKAGAAAFARMR